jgi:hypothetical protein
MIVYLFNYILLTIVVISTVVALLVEEVNYEKNTFATTSLNGTLGSGINGNQQIKSNESASTLDLMKAIIGESQGSGVLDRMAKCGATMHNMTEEQHQCVDDLAMGLEGLK